MVVQLQMASSDHLQPSSELTAPSAGGQAEVPSAPDCPESVFISLLKCYCFVPVQHSKVADWAVQEVGHTLAATGDLTRTREESGHVTQRPAAPHGHGLVEI